MKSREVLIAGVFLLLSAVVITVIGLRPGPSPAEQTPTIPAHENQEIVLQYFERILNQGDEEAIEEIFAPRHVLHVQTLPLEGTDYLVQLVESLRMSFPDIVFHVDQVIAEGEAIAVRYSFHGTHAGEYLGVAPTGEGVSATGILISKVEGGRIVETWDMHDRLGLYVQTGVVSSPVGQYTFDWGEQLEDPAVEPGDPEDNKALVLECVEQIWNQGNLDLVEALHAPGFRPHETTHGFVQDLGSLKQLVSTMRQYLPDLVVTVEAMVAEDYDVAARWTARGGDMEWWGITIYRIVDGKISETWWSRDSLNLFQQAGIISISHP